MSRFLFVSMAAFSAFFFAFSSGANGSILLSSGDFTLLGGTGITSSATVGTVIANGDVGLSPGPTLGITGFPPAVVNNGSIIATGPVTAQARLDLIKAQAGLAALPSNTNLSNVDLGGQTLPPGVYTFNSTAGLTGALILDGQGKNNVFWVFQIGTSLTTAVNSTVTIINPGSNGGSDYGIFWNAGSAVNIAANNQVAGNYLAGTSITLGTGSAGGGRELALAGITLDNNQVDAFGGPGGSDFSGGLIYNAQGIIVPSQSVPLSFRHFGKNHRTTLTTARIVRGNASSSATAIQSRVNNGRWISAAIHSGGNWKVTARSLSEGKNILHLRAANAQGNTTAVQLVTIWRH